MEKALKEIMRVFIVEVFKKGAEMVQEGYQMGRETFSMDNFVMGLSKDNTTLKGESLM